jgi:hypothetical protein
MKLAYSLNSLESERRWRAMDQTGDTIERLWRNYVSPHISITYIP